MHFDRPLEEESISGLAMKWREGSLNYTMEMTNGYGGTSWCTRRYVVHGNNCAYVVAEERFFGEPGRGWALNEYKYWYIEKSPARKGIEIHHECCSPFASHCKDYVYRANARNPEKALDDLLFELFEIDKFNEERNRDLNGNDG